jgi:hypothetical protein
VPDAAKPATIGEDRAAWIARFNRSTVDEVIVPGGCDRAPEVTRVGAGSTSRAVCRCGVVAVAARVPIGERRCSVRASSCAQAVSSQASARMAQQMRFWSNSCKNRLVSPVSFAARALAEYPSVSPLG